MKKKIAFIFSIPRYPKSDIKTIETFAHPHINYDILYLTDNEDLKKVLVKDMTIDKNKLETDYDFIVPIGAEPYKKLLKHAGGVTKYHGVYLDEPFRAIPLIDPTIIKIRPHDEEKIKEGFAKVYEAYKSDDIEELTKVAKTECTFVETDEQFNKFFEEFSKIEGMSFTYDVETTSLSPFEGEILGASFCQQINKAFYIPFTILLKHKEKVKELLTTNLVIMHNAKFDKKWTKIKLGIEIPRFVCTMLAHYFFIDPTKGTRKLKLLAMKGSNLGDYSREQDEYIVKFCRANKIKKEDFNFGLIPIEILIPYACADADATLQIYHSLILPAVKVATKEQKVCFKELILEGVDALMELELMGAPVSEKIIDELDEKYTKELEQIKIDLSSIPEIIQFQADQGKELNPNSPKQLGKLLFDYLRLPVQKKTPTGAPSTDIEVLEALAELHPVVALIRQMRNVVKMQGTYVVNIKKGIQATGRMHGTFNIDGTVSGRLSSSQEKEE